MTDAQLQGIAAQSANLAKLDLERGTFNFLLASYDEEDHKLHRLKKIEAQIIGRLGESWLNDEHTKDIGFEVLRVCVKLLPPDAIVFASGTNQFRPTKAFDALPEEQKKALLNSGHDRHHEAAKQGLLKLVDSLTVVVQTPVRACWYVQEIYRGRPVGKPDVYFCDRDEFDGRMKLFGEEDHAVSG